MLARKADGRVDAIYVFSGDGTYNEVLNAVSGDTPLGFVPGSRTSVLPAPSACRATRPQRLRASPRHDPADRAGPRERPPVRLRGGDRLRRRARAPGRRTRPPRRRPSARRPGLRVDGGALHRRDSRPLRPALELEGLGRSALALVGNCSPIPMQVRCRSTRCRRRRSDAGLDVLAPTQVRARDVPVSCGCSCGADAER